LGGRRPASSLIRADFERLPLDRLANLDGNKRPLLDWPFKCAGCGSRSVALFLFARCAERPATAF
jgi:hypothetical protein